MQNVRRVREINLQEREHLEEEAFSGSEYLEDDVLATLWLPLQIHSPLVFTLYLV